MYIVYSIYAYTNIVPFYVNAKNERRQQKIKILSVYSVLN